jgi:hypothetical protein
MLARLSHTLYCPLFTFRFLIIPRIRPTLYAKRALRELRPRTFLTVYPNLHVECVHEAT